MSIEDGIHEKNVAMMEKEFERFIEEKELLKSGDKLLVAVSGGVDSMVLCELLWRSKISFGIAHVNYGLRGEDSLKDERLVRNFAKGYKLDFHLSQPNTEAEAKNWKKGIQETARELRYAFFSELMEKHGYTKLATAHHGDDSAETMLYNFIKGTGLSGLKGIDVHRDRIIRPLLFF